VTTGGGNATKSTEGMPRNMLSYLFIFIVLAIPSYFLAPPTPLLDLPEFYTPARMVIAGKGADIYQPEAVKTEEWRDFPQLNEENKGRFVILYAIPPAIPLLVPAGFFPSSVIAWVWWLASLCAVVGSLGLASATFGISEKWMVRCGALLAAFGPHWESIKHSQLAPFVLVALCGALWCLRQEKMVPAMLALTVVLVLKPQIFLPLLLFVLGAYGIVRCLPYLAGAAAALSAASLALIGVEGYQNYFQLMSHSLQHRQWMVPEAGPTIRGQLLRLYGQADAAIVNVCTFIAVVVAATFFFLGRFFKDDELRLERGVIGAIPIGMLVSLHCHSYDLLMLLPVFLALFSYHRQQPIPKQAILALAACMLLFMMPFYNKVHYEYLLAGAVWNPFFFALLIFSEICLWLAWLPPATEPS
jgi:hypothetical protein